MPTSNPANQSYTINDLDVNTLMVNDLDPNDYSRIVQVKVPHFVDENGFLCVSMESDVYVGCYYGEFTDGTPYIDTSLVEWASRHNGYWEWVNPSLIMFTK